VLVETAKKLGLKCHERGTTVTIEGPRFSSKAESVMFRGWGCDVVNMTTVPEVCLAKEAGICYASIGLPTDYDSWKDEPVRKYNHNYTIFQV
jgi:5'-methylthioadenosine phosphorylase